MYDSEANNVNKDSAIDFRRILAFVAGRFISLFIGRKRQKRSAVAGGMGSCLACCLLVLPQPLTRTPIKLMVCDIHYNFLSFQFLNFFSSKLQQPKTPSWPFQKEDFISFYERRRRNLFFKTISGIGLILAINQLFLLYDRE